MPDSQGWTGLTYTLKDTDVRMKCYICRQWLQPGEKLRLRADNTGEAYVWAHDSCPKESHE